jgi:hypothetical protein
MHAEGAGAGIANVEVDMGAGVGGDANGGSVNAEDVEDALAVAHALGANIGGMLQLA